MDWAGPYIGGNIGYGWGAAPTYTAFTDNATQLPVYGDSPTARLNSANFGGQAGYNWTLGPMVAGIEGDFDYANQRGRTASSCPGSICNAALVPLNAATTGSVDYRLGWVATFRGRFGASLIPGLLAYVTTGTPFAQIARSGTVVGFDNTGAPTTTPFSTVTYRFGWLLGGGLEYRLIGNWTGKIEYLHMNFGAVRVTPDALANTATAFDSDARVTSDVVRLGLNYKFSANEFAARH